MLQRIIPFIIILFSFNVDAQECGTLPDDAAVKEYKKVEQLLSEGCDVNKRYYLAPNKYISLLRYGLHDAKMTQLLLDHGADPMLDLGREMSAFTYCAGFGDLETFQLLLDHVDDVNELDVDAGYQTPLSNAIRWNKIDHVKLLLDRGAKVKSDSLNNYIPPIVRAIQSGNVEIASLLFSKGADVNEPYYEDEEADCMNFCPVNATGLHEAIVMYNYADTAKCSEMLELIWEQNPDVNATNRLGVTVLDYACFVGQIDIVKELVSRGAKLSSERRTALHFAAEFRHPEIVKFLLEKGIDPNKKNFVGSTPLSSCLRRGSVDDEKTVQTLRYLLEGGANHNEDNYVRRELSKYEELKDLLD
jgi:ankyrin repeat protein